MSFLTCDHPAVGQMIVCLARILVSSQVFMGSKPSSPLLLHVCCCQAPPGVSSPHIIMTNGTQRDVKVTLNSNTKRSRLKKQVIFEFQTQESEPNRILLFLSNLGHIRGKIFDSVLLGFHRERCPSCLESSKRRRGNVQRPEPSCWAVSPTCLNRNHCTLLQPPAHFSSLWYEWRLLEDAIVWRADQKKGGKMRRNQPSIFLSAVPPFTPSRAPSLSLPLRLLSISVRLPHSLLYPIFSQGWTCVMALLSPRCHLARPI